jgi:3-hydroxyisobutyrate dehydrogenase/putative dehydrogenase
MGLPMATVLLRAGHNLTVYDVRASAVERAVVAGAVAADGPAAVARASDVLAVMVATPAQLGDVLFGQSGAGAALRPGSTVIVMATVGAAAIERTAERLDGVLVVDAPVSGGVTRAANGDLTFLLSGPEAGLRAADPLVSAMARQAYRFGDRPGDAQRAKMVNQLLCGVHIAAAAEALSLAASLGLDPARCWEALRSGAAASFMLDDRGARMLNPADEVRSALSIFVKDMGLVCDTAQAADVAVPVAEAARGLFAAGAAAGLGDRDDSALIELWRTS